MSPEPRRDLSVPIPVHVDFPDGTAEVEYAVNLSPGGICLHLRRAVEKGMQLRLRFQLPPSGLEVTCGAMVVWTQIAAELCEGAQAETGLCLQGLDPDVVAALEAWATQPCDRRR